MSEKTGQQNSDPPPPYSGAPYPTGGTPYPPPGNNAPYPPQNYQQPYPPPQSYQQGHPGTTTVVMGQPTTTTTRTVVVAGGNCPSCRVGYLHEQFTCCGIMLAIFFFPIGLLCCLMMRMKVCSHCGAVF